MTNHKTRNQDPGDCLETEEAPKDHHSNKSIRPGHGCLPHVPYPVNNQPVVNNWQYDDPRSIAESNVEDMAAVKQPLSEVAEGASLRVPKDEISRKARVEGMSL